MRIIIFIFSFGSVIRFSNRFGASLRPQSTGPLYKRQRAAIFEHKTVRSLKPFAWVFRDTVNDVGNANNTATFQLCGGQAVL